MKYHLISDNSFFLSGVEWLSELDGYAVKLVKLPFDIKELSISPGDVVVLYISNHRYRTQFMRFCTLRLCRVFILVDVPVFRSVKTYFPWLVNASVSIQDLLSLIRMARITDVKYQSKTRQLRNIFDLITKGASVEDVANCSHLTRDYIYRVTREEVMRYGMADCNRTAMLICRDINLITELSGVSGNKMPVCHS